MLSLNRIFYFFQFIIFQDGSITAAGILYNQIVCKKRIHINRRSIPRNFIFRNNLRVKFSDRTGILVLVYIQVSKLLFQGKSIHIQGRVFREQVLDIYQGSKLCIVDGLAITEHGRG